MWTFGELAPRYVGRPGTGWDPLFGIMDNLLARQVLFASEWPVFPMSRAVAEWKAPGLKQSTLGSYSARTSSTCSATGGTAMTGLVEFEITGGVAEARLNRPERLNAVTPDLVEELCGALERGIAADLAALILAGNGSSFCSGYDLRQPPRQRQGRPVIVSGGTDQTVQVWDLKSEPSITLRIGLQHQARSVAATTNQLVIGTTAELLRVDLL